MTESIVHIGEVIKKFDRLCVEKTKDYYVVGLPNLPILFLTPEAARDLAKELLKAVDGCTWPNCGCPSSTKNGPYCQFSPNITPGEDQETSCMTCYWDHCSHKWCAEHPCKSWEAKSPSDTPGK